VHFLACGLRDIKNNPYLF